jgi:hypothetical protein
MQINFSFFLEFKTTRSNPQKSVSLPCSMLRDAEAEGTQPQRGKPQSKANWPQRNARLTKDEEYKFLSMCSLRSFAAKKLV